MAMALFIGPLVYGPPMVIYGNLWYYNNGNFISPDIDEPRSKIGRRYPAISFIIHFVLPGYLNTFTIFISYSILLLLNSTIRLLVAGYGGIYCRIYLQPAGLVLLYPFSRRRISFTYFKNWSKYYRLAYDWCA